MSLPQYATPLVLELGPSLRLAWALGLAHGLTLIVTLFLPVYAGWRAAMGALISASAWHSISRHALRRDSAAVVHMTWDSDDRWVLRRRDGQELQAKLLGDTLVLPLFVVLNFKPSAGRRFSVVLLSDCVPPERLRQLRVRLRISGASPPAASDKTQP